MLVHHDAAGAPDYILRTDALDLSAEHEPKLRVPLPVLDEALPSLHRGPWFSGWVLCLDCIAAWVAIAPVVADVARAGRDLVCVSCAGRRSAPFLNGWCSACGDESVAAQEEGAPAEGGECDLCGAATVFVEAA